MISFRKEINQNTIPIPIVLGLYTDHKRITCSSKSVQNCNLIPTIHNVNQREFKMKQR